MSKPDRTQDERFAEWVDGCMSERDRDRFEAELRVNARLREDLAEYERTVAIVQQALRAKTRDVSVADRVFAAIAAGEARTMPRRPVHWRAVVWGLACAAALLGLTVLIDAWTPKEPAAITMAKAPEVGLLERVGEAGSGVPPSPMDLTGNAPEAVAAAKDRRAAKAGLRDGDEVQAEPVDDAKADGAKRQDSVAGRRNELRDGEPTPPSVGLATGSDDLYLGASRTKPTAPTPTEKDPGEQAKKLEAETKRVEEQVEPTPPSVSPAAPGGVVLPPPMADQPVARAQVPHETTPDAGAQSGGVNKEVAAADTTERAKAERLEVPRAPADKGSTGTSAETEVDPAARSRGDSMPGDVVPEIVLVGEATPVPRGRGAPDRKPDALQGSTAEKAAPGGALPAEPGAPTTGKAKSAVDVGVEFERLLSRQLSQPLEQVVTDAWVASQGTLRVTPVPESQLSALQPSTRPLATGGATADKPTASESPDPVERSWVIEGSRAEVAAVLARLGAIARAAKLEMKSGETTLPAATGEKQEPLARDHEGSDLAKVAPRDSVRLVLRLRLRPRK